MPPHTLRKLPARHFSKLVNFPHPDRAVQDRVMTTPQWPIPYYQRHFKAYPIRERKLANFGMLDNAISERHWHVARHHLKATAAGRETLDHVENNLQLTSELTRLRPSLRRYWQFGQGLCL